VWRRVAYVVIGFAFLAGFMMLSIPTSAPIADVGTALLTVSVLAMLGLTVALLRPGSGHDREREVEAREIFDRTGRWPDDD